MSYSWLSDKQLEARVAELLERAHDAKQPNYAPRGNDWYEASMELERRRNAQPRR